MKQRKPEQWAQFENDLGRMCASQVEMNKICRYIRWKRNWHAIHEYVEIGMIHLLLTIVWMISFTSEPHLPMIVYVLGWLCSYWLTMWIIIKARRPRSRTKAHWVRG